ncbi:hypothetical protein LCGC14_0928600 [marine sediment metagenome]|jgi:hypothetical protein|uniref:TetR/AcrR family transcriptional regulator n=2 Tax=root TaxID=1 RepID=A0A831QNX9_9FLAO|nr:TetR/AcrR family transcriptional regulator [Pricia antarctica]|tara:strand:- start:9589 stop:10161 length:573 start_codon:yes stop_codon:yes gene_type:complete
MTAKEEILQVAKERFLMFGSKHISMDELAVLLGISKKTIYGHFPSKEDLVNESIKLLITEFNKDASAFLNGNNGHLEKIASIYDVVFDYLVRFKPSFVVGLRKYYPKAYGTYREFTKEFVFTIIFDLLVKAKYQGKIRQETNLKLFCKLYFFKLENRLFTEDNLLDDHSKEQLFEAMILVPLRGIRMVPA